MTKVLLVASITLASGDVPLLIATLIDGLLANFEGDRFAELLL